MQSLAWDAHLAGHAEPGIGCLQLKAQLHRLGLHLQRKIVKTSSTWSTEAQQAPTGPQGFLILNYSASDGNAGGSRLVHGTEDLAALAALVACESSASKRSTCAESQSKEARDQSSFGCTAMSLASAVVSLLASDSDCCIAGNMNMSALAHKSPTLGAALTDVHNDESSASEADAISRCGVGKLVMLLVGHCNGLMSP